MHHFQPQDPDDSCFCVDGLFAGDDQEEKCRSFIELTPGETQGQCNPRKYNLRSTKMNRQSTTRSFH